MTHQPTISFSISFQFPFNRAGGRTSNVRQEMPVRIRIQRLLVVLGSGLLLLYALIYGPGRGPTLISADDQSYGLIRILAYGCFLAGAILVSRRAFAAVFILVVGLIARSVLDLKYSSGRLWFEHDGWSSLSASVLVLAFYLFSFVLPALLTIDSFRSLRCGTRIDEGEQAAHSSQNNRNPRYAYRPKSLGLPSLNRCYSTRKTETSPMPKRILIIGLIFCFGGASAIWDVISDLSRSHINLNFAVLLLPVGVGLLRGRSRSQWWARFWIILGYIVCAVLIGAAVISPQNVSASWYDRDLRGPEAVPYVIAGSICLALLLYFVHRLLYSPRADAYFNSSSELE